MAQNLILVITTLMIFILLFFILFLLHKGRRVYANIFLSLYLISQIIGILHSSLFHMKSILLPEYIHLFFTGYPAIFLWGVFYYFFIYALLQPDFKLRIRHVLHLIPFIIVLAYFTANFYLSGTERKLELLRQDSPLYQALNIFNQCFSFQIFSYNVAAVIQYLRYRKRIKNFISTKPENDFWIKTALFGFLAACFISYIGKVAVGIEINTEQIDSQAIRYGMANIAFLILYCVLFYLAISHPGVIMQPEKREKYWYSKLDSREAKKILAQLEEYMVRKKPYQKPGLTIKELASETHINERYLSQVINEVKKQNFFDFINAFRVEHAKQLLAKNRESRRTMLDILWDSGFNSKTAFNTVFKKFTGTTTSAFQEKS